MSAEKLYYIDSHLFDFTATVLLCQSCDGGYTVILDKTAFFPEGGGQPSDTGYIGKTRVSYVYEKDGEVFHLAESPLEIGKTFDCRIDSERRLEFMKKHSAEHIISGIIHNRFGYDNVGFHLSENETTIDTSGKLTADDIAYIELEANRAVQNDLRIKAYFPDPDELENIEYRSKKEIDGDVRIVMIEGVDLCACCAPHVDRTGEIGIVKILKYYSWKGGMRIHITAGIEAYLDYRDKFELQTRIAKERSAAPENLEEIITKAENESARLKDSLRSAEAVIVEAFAERSAESANEYECFIIESLTDEAARKLAEKCAGFKKIGAVFFGAENSYGTVICSKTDSAKHFTETMKEKIDCRGGGNDSMVRGRACASKAEIKDFFGTINE